MPIHVGGDRPLWLDKGRSKVICIYAFDCHFMVVPHHLYPLSLLHTFHKTYLLVPFLPDYFLSFWVTIFQ